jgi:hypothetical protein
VSTIDATSALIDALAALAKAEKAINLALAAIGLEAPKPPTRTQVAVRSSGAQILAILASAGEPITLIDIADGIVAMRRDEDEPRKRGGTRYQELARNALGRLIDRGLVERVPPPNRHGFMKFQRTTIAA